MHAPISLGTTSDDRFMPPGYLATFAQMPELILTEKLDGQNNCFNKYGVFARSHTSPSAHPWDAPMHERWKLFKNDLNDLEIFGENMYGIHSIAYRKLESYYYVFAVRERGRWLSWEEVCFYAAMLDFPTVPVIPVQQKLSEMFHEKKHEDVLLADWFKANLGMSWEEGVRQEGLLGGFDPQTLKPCSEGYVVRNAAGYAQNEGVVQVAPNEFNNLFKLVRQSHVQTTVHWTKTWKPATLKDYNKYGWQGQQYLSRS